MKNTPSLSSDPPQLGLAALRAKELIMHDNTNDTLHQYLTGSKSVFQAFKSRLHTLTESIQTGRDRGSALRPQARQLEADVKTFESEFDKALRALNEDYERGASKIESNKRGAMLEFKRLSEDTKAFRERVEEACKAFLEQPSSALAQSEAQLEQERAKELLVAAEEIRAKMQDRRDSIQRLIREYPLLGLTSSDSSARPSGSGNEEGQPIVPPAPSAGPSEGDEDNPGPSAKASASSEGGGSGNGSGRPGIGGGGDNPSNQPPLTNPEVALPQEEFASGLEGTNATSEITELTAVPQHSVAPLIGSTVSTQPVLQSSPTLVDGDLPVQEDPSLGALAGLALAQAGGYVPILGEQAVAQQGDNARPGNRQAVAQQGDNARLGNRQAAPPQGGEDPRLSGPGTPTEAQVPSTTFSGQGGDQSRGAGSAQPTAGNLEGGTEGLATASLSSATDLPPGPPPAQPTLQFADDTIFKDKLERLLKFPKGVNSGDQLWSSQDTDFQSNWLALLVLLALQSKPARLQKSRTLEKTEDKHQPLREGILSVKQNDGILKPSAYFLEKTDCDDSSAGSTRSRQRTVRPISPTEEEFLIQFIDTCLVFEKGYCAKVAALASSYRHFASTKGLIQHKGKNKNVLGKNQLNSHLKKLFPKYEKNGVRPQLKNIPELVWMNVGIKPSWNY